MGVTHRSTGLHSQATRIWWRCSCGTGGLPGPLVEYLRGQGYRK
jgi:hypothetical protein